MNNYLKFGLITTLVLLISYAGLRTVFYTYIQPDEYGVWMTNGGNNGIEDYQFWQGHFPLDFNPLTKGFVVPAQPWTFDMPEKIIYSAQKGEWTTDPQFTFRVDREQVPLVCFRNNNLLSSGQDSTFFRAVAQHLLASLVNDVFYEKIGAVDDTTLLLTNTFKTQKVIEDSIRIRFKRVGYVLENFVSNINPPKSIIANNRAKNEAETAAITAKSNVVKAEAQAKVQVATAKADAEAMLVSARAAAEATRLRQSVLTEAVLKEMWIDKWDGALPYYSGGNAPMLMIPK